MKPPTIWHPAPRGLIMSAALKKWTRKQPAPDLVVYLWAWSQMDDGEKPTRRQLARDFGWTEHKARTVIDRVKDDRKAWHDMTAPKAAPTRRPPVSNNGGHLGDRTAQEPPRNNQEPPDRTRGSTTQHNTTQRQEPVPVPVQVDRGFAWPPNR